MRSSLHMVNGLIVLLFLVACDDGPNVNEFNYEPEVSVFALLLLNSGQTIIHLERTFRSLDTVPEDRGIDDAQVMIKWEDQEVSFSHRGAGQYVEIGEKLRLVPGTSYQLFIHCRDGRQITAQCIMPAPPRIVSPAPQQQVAAYHSLPVAWQSDISSRYFLVSVRGNINAYSAESVTDSLAMDFLPFYFAQPDIYVLKVGSIDRNYYEYIRMPEDENPVWRIHGGIGVFGALAYDERVIIAQ